uniref:Alpha-1,4 glucan phosphorylase n=1 Tax=Rhabditophanes sp. KR3021 TaxID=114890 RepID=A0AC35TFT1_9BILA
MATLGIPACGYGLRYDYGIFKQLIQDGWQVEEPDDWLRFGNPWEKSRQEKSVIVNFNGKVIKDENGKSVWTDTILIQAVPYDTPIPSYLNNVVNTLRLWSAKAENNFHMKFSSDDDYMQAVMDRSNSENITQALYPIDNMFEGKEIRLKQQYFLSSATLQDIIRRFKNDNYGNNKRSNFATFPEKIAIHLNDTHPSIGIPEFIRLLTDVEGLEMEEAWNICMKTFSYTNHALLPECLERWPVTLLAKLLPRHLEIICEINHRFMDEVSVRYPGNLEIMRRMSIIEEADHGGDKRDEWVVKLTELVKLKAFVDEPGFLDSIMRIKQENKLKVVEYIQKKYNIAVNPASMFDVHVKRIHEYKRQLLSIFHVITLYNRIKANPNKKYTPRTVIFGGKCSPGNMTAKLIIKLITSVASIVNNDVIIGSKLKVIFLENYKVSIGELIIPAADLSEQISTAGTEASGTANFKFMLNGALTIGTLDGANIELAEETGEENIFIFGKTVDEINAIKSTGYRSEDFINKSPNLKYILDQIEGGFFTLDEGVHVLKNLASNIKYNDRFMVCADYDDYIRCQDIVSATFDNKRKWAKMALLNIASAGKFSTDRSIAEYAQKIWGIEGSIKLSAISENKY